MLPIASDAWPYLWKLVAAAAVFGLLGWSTLAWIALALAAFVAFFFRDPDREIPPDPDLVVSPADGKVLRIDTVDEPFLGGRGVRVSIFLNVFNVHINRAPIGGTVLFQTYRQGKMLPAFRDHASELNERNTIGIEGRRIRAVVHQITGMLARRIVCRVGPGDRLRKGERFGLIKLGSCTEVILPEWVELWVQPGQKVKGGSTVIARIPGVRPEGEGEG
ncbi:MAG: phosphatidylserine decarboxylase family protein [Candidatus Dadabacteria bacterium]|nr:MAG: phosphatidylserine decarboxylase family protein [Candidatus Dadabacteria bacterium]